MRSTPAIPKLVRDLKTSSSLSLRAPLLGPTPASGLQRGRRSPILTLDLDFALLRDGASDGQLASGAYSKKALDFACFFEPVSHVL